MNRKFILYITICMWYLLLANTTFAYTRQDSLRGGNGSGRSWWDARLYHLSVSIDTLTRTVAGQNSITARVTNAPGDSIQIDLQEPMMVDSVFFIRNRQESDTIDPPPYMMLDFKREGNVWWITGPFKKELVPGNEFTLTVCYHGKPREAKMPPWDGGFIWTKDSTGKPWISVACQGLGASSWWPCKDAQWDEPEYLRLTYRSNSGLPIIANGKSPYHSNIYQPKYAKQWAVDNPINTYNVTFYLGDYVYWKDTLMGENGRLEISFYVLRQNEEKAKKHFSVVKQMLHCFEHWMGPYPIYEDGYKLVDAPHLGMEHQSAIAYGNQYKMGYHGMDRSQTGVGLLFDFIIVHESGHEWFGNNITAKDIADNWIHEGFTTYTEVLFAECAFGKENAFKYNIGKYSHILNDKPVIGNYGVHDDGSSDIYNKGAAVVHMIRMMIGNDEKFRLMLREMNKKYYHQAVTSQEIEEFIMNFTGLELKPFFDQYLRTAKLPTLDWYIKKKRLHYRFKNAVAGFTLPLEVTDGENKADIRPTNDWQSVPWKKGGYNLEFSKDFLVQS